MGLSILKGENQPVQFVVECSTLCCPCVTLIQFIREWRATQLS